MAAVGRDGEEEQEEDVDLDDDALASLPPSVWPTKSLQLTRKGQVRGVIADAVRSRVAEAAVPAV